MALRCEEGDSLAKLLFGSSARDRHVDLLGARHHISREVGHVKEGRVLIDRVGILEHHRRVHEVPLQVGTPALIKHQVPICPASCTVPQLPQDIVGVVVAIAPLAWPGAEPLIACDVEAVARLGHEDELVLGLLLELLPDGLHVFAAAQLCMAHVDDPARRCIFEDGLQCQVPMVCHPVNVLRHVLILEERHDVVLHHVELVIMEHELQARMILPHEGAEVLGQEAGQTLGSVIHRLPLAHGRVRLVVHCETPDIDALTRICLDELREHERPCLLRLVILTQKTTIVAIAPAVLRRVLWGRVFCVHRPLQLLDKLRATALLPGALEEGLGHCCQCRRLLAGPALSALLLIQEGRLARKLCDRGFVQRGSGATLTNTVIATRRVDHLAARYRWGQRLVICAHRNCRCVWDCAAPPLVLEP
mmetsp:Transcript_80564/g.209405  ORF Transcript_80564/g.209405 Transcript_80564/m.209405 type:complete len:419 (-) Transcript_80564:1095-2351(-)